MIAPSLLCAVALVARYSAAQATAENNTDITAAEADNGTTVICGDYGKCTTMQYAMVEITKYRPMMRAAAAVTKQASDLPLQQYALGITAYKASMQVGTPPKNFNVLFDTGSFTMWLYGATCTDAACKAAKNSYDVTKSSTGAVVNGPPGSQSYADGSGYNGTLVQDTIIASGYQVQNFKFTQVTNYRSSSPSGVSAADTYQDGIVGMGFHPRVAGASNTLIEQLVEDGHLPYPQFSWYITLDEAQGYATFGGYDLTLFQDPKAQPAWVPMIVNDDLFIAGKLALPLVSVLVNGQTLETFTSHASPITGKAQGTTGAASWDTGTASSIVSDTLVTTLGGMIPGAKQVRFSGSKDISYVVPCGAKSEMGGPTVTLMFSGGGSLTITALEYVEADENGDGNCFLALTGRAGGYRAGTYLIGNTFLKRYVNIFDFQKRWIGFALALGRNPAIANVVQGTIKSSSGHYITFYSAVGAVAFSSLFLF
ncbi:aspartic peptidase domain-containing protein [Chytriomyces cf. hyalinus JEL632]|nr:aspartic peptidase domain-containing protein [Chytriomyces cf. hyalinus JEL632]